MGDRASSALTPFKPLLVEAINRLRNAKDPDGKLLVEEVHWALESMEKVTDDVVREVRRVSKQVDNLEARTALNQSGNAFSMALTRCKTAILRGVKASDPNVFATIENEILPVAKSMQELFQVAGGISYSTSPKPNRKVEAIKTQSPIHSRSSSMTKQTEIALAEFNSQFPFRAEEWRVYLEGVLDCVTQLSRSIDEQDKDQYPFIVEQIVSQVEEFLESIAGLSLDSLDQTFRQIFEQQIQKIGSELAALDNCSHIASGAWPPEDAHDNLRIAAFSVAKAMKELIIFSKQIVLYLYHRSRAQKQAALVRSSSSDSIGDSPPTSLTLEPTDGADQTAAMSPIVESPVTPATPATPGLGAASPAQATGTPATATTPITPSTPATPLTPATPTPPLTTPPIPSAKPPPLDPTPPAHPPPGKLVRKPSASSLLLENLVKQYEGPGTTKGRKGSISDGFRRRSIFGNLRKQKTFSSSNSEFFATDTSQDENENRKSKAYAEREKQEQEQKQQELRKLEEVVLDETGITFKDNEKKMVKSGELSKLVERLTWHRHPDPVFAAAFLLTYRAFTTPRQLLTELVKRFSLKAPEDKGLTDAQKELFEMDIAHPVRLRVFSILKNWADKHYLDFHEDPTLLSELEQFLNGTVTQKSQAFATQLKKLLDKKKQDVKYIIYRPTYTPPSNSSKVMSMVDSKDILEFDDMEMAKCITFMEYELYRAIQPKEFLNQSWNDYKKGGEKNQRQQDD
eukprot:NODE_40_length_2872_cov_41.807650_g24_i0.p1 GENE.NODE_40_length_2872_cov_41.807650_g24_i0~~NODE_40_length_2872_cov_41.807650_g24_i0.p1  ORF type:complete len:741 (-),score=141.07 NODE_40_length_2872_cov_41.807650_g24_i0:605-2827(-)